MAQQTNLPAPRKWTLGRRILAAVLAALLMVTLWLAVWAYRLTHGFTQAQTHHQVDLPVDLSRAATIEGTLDETYLYAHGAALLLKLTPATEEQDPSALLSGLQGTLTIRNGFDDRPISFDIRTCSTYQDGSIHLWSYHPAVTGKFPFTLAITSPAPALAGRDQRLLGQYQLCGLEAMPGHITTVAAIFIGLITLILGLRLLTSRTPLPRPGP